MKLPVVPAIFVDELGDFHIVTAILRNLGQFAFLEPADRLQPFSSSR